MPQRRCGRVNDAAGANAGDRQHRATSPDRENVARDERHVGARQNGQQRRDADERVEPRITLTAAPVQTPRRLDGSLLADRLKES